MKENNIVDINGSIHEAARGVFQHICGTVLVLILFGFLFAPLFTEWFRPMVERKYRTPGNMYRSFPLIEAEMTKIRIRLWIVAVVGWFVVLVSFLAA